MTELFHAETAPILALTVDANWQMHIKTALPLETAPLVILKGTRGGVTVMGLEDRAAALSMLTEAIVLVGQHFKAEPKPEAPSIIQVPNGARVRPPWSNGR